MSLEQVKKSDLMAILRATPDTQQNQGLINMIRSLLQKTRVFRKPFSYSTNFTAATLTAGVTLTNNLPVQSDADFLVQNQTYTADVAAAGQTAGTATYPLVNVLLSNSGTGDQFMNQAVPITQIFGNGQFPYVLPEPLLVPARSNLTVQVNNRDAAQAYNLFLTFNGVKLFSMDN